MTTTTRTAALGVFAATLAAVLAFGIMPRSVMAHPNHQVTFSAGLTGAYYDVDDDRVEPFICVSGSLLPDSEHVDPAHHHNLVIRIGIGSSGNGTPYGGYVDIGKDGRARALHR